MYTSIQQQVDVAGTMYFWGVTIDTASSILLTLCVGLAVDYSAHIGHTFMTVSGAKNGTSTVRFKVKLFIQFVASSCLIAVIHGKL